MSSWNVGKVAEDIALKYLLSKGFTLKERNWRAGHREIDLIMESDKALHIIEVKSLINREDFEETELMRPYKNVTHRKQRLLISAACLYVVMNNIAKETQFDIVSVVLLKQGSEIEYFPDAFSPLW